MSRKEKIHSTGASLFRKNGYQNCSMADIAEAVGIKPSSLYNHIHSKQQILQELLQEGAGLFEKGMENITSSSLNPLEKIKRVVSLHVQIAVANSDLMALMLTEWRNLEEPARQAFLKQRESYEQQFSSLLTQAADQGLLAIANIDLVTFTMLTTLNRFYAWYEKHKNNNPLDLEHQLSEFFLSGLRT